VEGTRLKGSPVKRKKSIALFRGQTFGDGIRRKDVQNTLGVFSKPSFRGGESYKDKVLQDTPFEAIPIRVFWETKKKGGAMRKFDTLKRGNWRGEGVHEQVLSHF